MFTEPPRDNITYIFSSSSFFQRWLNEEQGPCLLNFITKTKACIGLLSFYNGKSPRSDGWAINFCVGFWDLLENDFTIVVEEAHSTGKIHPPFHPTFITNTPKVDSP